MAKRTSIYATMTASDLARVTRERGLTKPDVGDIGAWADWLEAQDKPTLTVSVGEPVTDAEAAAQLDAQLTAIPDFAAMNKAEVVALAESYGMVKTAKTSKGEAEDFILAALGVSEDEQAAHDANGGAS